MALIEISQKPSVVLFIYGAGGHRTEMQRLMYTLKARSQSGKFEYVTLGDGILDDDAAAHYPAKDVRDKHSRIRSMKLFISSTLQLFKQVREIQETFDVSGIISTGPGVAVLPFLVFKQSGVKTVFLETFCRFETKSITGRLMYRIADRFLVQNIELLRLYPKAEYCGRL